MLKKLKDIKKVQQYQIINLIDVIDENGLDVKVEDPRDNRIVTEVEIDEELAEAQTLVIKLQVFKDDIIIIKSTE